jgi:hypothetical protein
MLEVVSTIDRQLTSTVLAGNQFESLEAQSDALDTIHLVRTSGAQCSNFRRKI